MREPQTYPEMNLKDLVADARPITYGIVQPGPDISPDGVPLIRGKDYSSGKVDSTALYHVRPEIDAPYSRSKIRGGDILFSIVGYVGQAAVVPESLTGANITQTTARISIDEAKAHGLYIFHHLSSPHFRPQVSRFEKGSAQPGLNLSDVERLRVTTPPRPVQQRIAEILSTVDEAIEQTEALIAKTQQIKAGLMHDLFTRGVTPDGQLRPSRDEAPHLYKKSSFGWIPKEWVTTTLSDCSDFVTSGSRGWASYYSEEGPLFIRIGNLTRENPNFRFEEITRVRPPSTSEGQRTRLECGDVLISITADLGIIGVVPDSLGEAYINQHIALVRVQSGLETSRWLGHWLGASKAQSLFRRIDDSGAKAGINLPTIRAFPILLPLKKEERHWIVSRLDAIDESISIKRLAVSELNALKTGLMHDLLTGHVRVPIPAERTKAGR